MKIILKADIDSLGKKGKIIEVKDGYARNYLLPKNFASIATKANVRVYNEQQRINEKKEISKLKNAEVLAGKLSNVSITATVAAGEDDKIFGTVTTQNISDLLKEKGFDVDKHIITIPEPIKSLGVFNIPVKVFKNVKAEVKLWVIKE